MLAFLALLLLLLLVVPIVLTIPLLKGNFILEWVRIFPGGNSFAQIIVGVEIFSRTLKLRLSDGGYEGF